MPLFHIRSVNHTAHIPDDCSSRSPAPPAAIELRLPRQQLFVYRELWTWTNIFTHNFCYKALFPRMEDVAILLGRLPERSILCKF
jgi:hypothetical protein